MRYIDADKHLQKLRERRDTAIIWELNCNDEATKDRAQEAILIFNECISELIDAPTADVRENVKGKWIIKTDGFVIKRVWGVCSKCGNTLDFSGVNAGRGDANFCPNCGADMRGDQT